MRIPSGDLAPVRRRGGRSSYVRRRPRWPYAAAVLALTAAAGGGYLLTTEDQAVPTRLVQPSTAPSPSSPSCTPAKGASVARVPVTLPAPTAVVFQLLNGTDRSGLGKTVGDELAARSLKTTMFANAPAPVTGDTVVAYGPGRLPSAQLLAANILGVRLVAAPAVAGQAAGVTVTLGSNYTRLTTPPEIQAYVASLTVAVPTAPSVARSCR